MIEVALVTTAIAIVAIAAVQAFGYKVACMFQLTSYAISRPDRTEGEWRTHLPAIHSGDKYINCGEVLAQ